MLSCMFVESYCRSYFFRRFWWWSHGALLSSMFCLFTCNENGAAQWWCSIAHRLVQWHSARFPIFVSRFTFCDIFHAVCNQSTSLYWREITSETPLLDSKRSGPLSFLLLKWLGGQCYCRSSASMLRINKYDAVRCYNVCSCDDRCPKKYIICFCCCGDSKLFQIPQAASPPPSVGSSVSTPASAVGPASASLDRAPSNAKLPLSQTAAVPMSAHAGNQTPVVLDLLGDLSSKPAPAAASQAAVQSVQVLGPNFQSDSQAAQAPLPDSATPLGFGDWLQVRKSGKTFYFRSAFHFKFISFIAVRAWKKLSGKNLCNRRLSK